MELILGGRRVAVLPKDETDAIRALLPEDPGERSAVLGLLIGGTATDLRNEADAYGTEAADCESAADDARQEKADELARVAEHYDDMIADHLVAVTVARQNAATKKAEAMRVRQAADLLILKGPELG